MESKITELAQQALKNKLFPGAVIGVVGNTPQKLILPLGNLTYDNENLPVRADTIYDTASLTKSVVTASLALQLIDRGKLNLNNSVGRYLPEFVANQPEKRAVTIKHLLTYSLSLKLPPMSSLKDKPPQEVMQTILTAPLADAPGTVYRYVNPTAIILGEVVRAVTSEELDKLAQKEFFKPLGMHDTSFFPQELERVSPTTIDKWRGGEVRGKVHDESAYVFMKENRIIGSAGMFSTAPDLLKFITMLLNGGIYNGKRFLSEEILKQSHTNQLANIGESCGLGWEMGQTRFMGSKTSDQAFAKTGFTGCLILIDPVKERGFVLLSNHVYPAGISDRDKINAFRSKLADIVFGDF